jgi:hypothetical protein
MVCAGALLRLVLLVARWLGQVISQLLQVMLHALQRGPYAMQGIRPPRLLLLSLVERHRARLHLLLLLH